MEVVATRRNMVRSMANGEFLRGSGLSGYFDWGVTTRMFGSMRYSTLSKGREATVDTTPLFWGVVDFRAHGRLATMVMMMSLLMLLMMTTTTL